MVYLQRFLACLRGATAIEYVLIVAGVALAIALIVFTFGEDVASLFKAVQGAYDQRAPVE